MTACAVSPLRAGDGRDYQISAHRSYFDCQLLATQKEIILLLKLEKGEDSFGRFLLHPISQKCDT